MISYRYLELIFWNALGPFVYAQYIHTYTYRIDRLERGMSALFGGKAELVSVLQDGVRENTAIALSPKLAAQLLELLENSGTLNSLETESPDLSFSISSPKQSLRRSISNFQEKEERLGKTLTSDSIHSTLFAYGALAHPIPAAGDGSRSTKFDGYDRNKELAVHGRLGITKAVSENTVGHLEDIQNWDFDVIELERILGKSTSGHTLALQMVGRATLQYFGLYDTLGLDEKTVHRYLYVVGKEYENTPYHNALHGADVMQSVCAALVNAAPLLDALSNESVFAALIAAAVHDVGHFGRTNNFLINTHHRLAMVYNDQSVLENYHVARAMELMQQKNCNILGCFADQSERKKIRKILIHCVLHTDMAKHMDTLARLDTDLSGKGVNAVAPEEHVRCLGLLLHCCDVGNPAKNWPIYLEWTDRVMQEFNAEYDEETELHIPHGFFNPAKPLPEFQLGFVNFVVKRLYQSVNKIEGIDLSRPLFHLHRNVQQWKLQIVGRTIRSRSTAEERRERRNSGKVLLADAYK